MEGHCSTGQRPQRIVAPMEEGEEDSYIIFLGTVFVLTSLGIAK